MTGRSVVLKKCGQHDECQLQQVNGGEWEHTPRQTPLSTRLAPPLPDYSSVTAAAEAVKDQAHRDGLKVANAADRAGALVRTLESRAFDLHDLRDQLTRRMPETVEAIEERAARLDGIAAELFATINALAERIGGIQRFERVEELYGVVEKARDEWRGGMAAFGARLDDVEHRVNHEREERLQATAKGQRQVREIMRTIHRKD
jgi:hypothetical protein